MNQRYFDIIAGRDRTVFAKVARGTLAALAYPYAAAAQSRNTVYAMGLKKPTSLGRPTICIGNLTTGGTGKTPVTLWFARKLLSMGQKPAILLRGHKGEAGFGHVHGSNSANNDQDPPPPPRIVFSDETALYEQALGDDVPIAADPDRARSARWLLHNHPDITCFLLDDGFQHRQVTRNFNLLLIDATNPFGYGQVLPRGLLREPMSAIRRADACLITRADQVDEIELDKIKQTLHRYAPNVPVWKSAHVWGEFHLATGETLQATPKALHLICGIGNPDSFFKQAEERFSMDIITKRLALPDHFDPTPGQLRSWLTDARADEALILTTQKDWVKWARVKDQLPDGFEQLVATPELKIDWLEGEEECNKNLQSQFAIPSISER